MLDQSTNVGARLAKEELQGDNAIGIMMRAKAKGELFNVTQVMGIVGQQNYRGKRLEKTITNRTRCLPYFDRNDPDPAARGFCQHSYWDGLTPAEMFFTHEGGREGLMDTSLKTAETGNLHRRMVKVLENIHVAYDGTVRNTIGTILQFTYGGDGYDPMYLMDVRGISSFIDIKWWVAYLNIQRGWVPKSIVAGEPGNRGTESRQAGKTTDEPPPKPVTKEEPSDPRLQMTSFEYVALVGKLADKLSRSEIPVTVETDSHSVIEVAKMMIAARRTPLVLRRHYPNGYFEDITANEMTPPA